MGFSRPEYWSGLPCPPQGIFPTQGPNPGFPHCRQILYHLSQKKAQNYYVLSHFSRVRLFATPWCIPPGSSVPGILQAKILECVAISSAVLLYDPTISLCTQNNWKQKHNRYESIYESTAALFTSAKKWKQFKCPPRGGWINKMVCLQTMECYPALKTKAHTTAWMKLEDTTLSKISLSQKDKYNIIPLTWGP